VKYYIETERVKGVEWIGWIVIRDDSENENYEYEYE
jgi:hypothetical protein